MDLSTQIKEKILSLDSALKEQHPTFPVLLKEIYVTLKENPDVVTLLEPSEVGVIANGLKRQANTDIATAALAKKGKSLKSISISDL